MIYRAFAIGIVLFWMGMTAWLVRLELAPGEARMLPVPTAQVWKLIFRHEEMSALTLFNGRQRLGELHLQPRHRSADGGPWHQLTGTGAFTLNFPGVSGQRIVMHGTLDLDDQEEIQRVELAAHFTDLKQKQAGTTVIFDGHPPGGQWHYALRSGEEVFKERSGTMEDLLDDPYLRAYGFDPRAFGQMGRQQAAVTKMTARHGTLRMNGEDVETYVVTIRQGDGLESSIHLNQLGQILAIKTFLGYDLYDDAFAP